MNKEKDWIVGIDLSKADTPISVGEVFSKLKRSNETLGDFLRELSKHWVSLSDNDKSEVAEKMMGIRGHSKFIYTLDELVKYLI